MWESRFKGKILYIFHVADFKEVFDVVPSAHMHFWRTSGRPQIINLVYACNFSSILERDMSSMWDKCFYLFILVLLALMFIISFCNAFSKIL